MRFCQHSAAIKTLKNVSVCCRLQNQISTHWNGVSLLDHTGPGLMVLTGSFSASSCPLQSLPHCCCSCFSFLAYSASPQAKSWFLISSFLPASSLHTFLSLCQESLSSERREAEKKQRSRPIDGRNQENDQTRLAYYKKIHFEAIIP